MSSRGQIVAALREALPEAYLVKDVPTPIPEPSADVDCVVVVERVSVKPAPNVQGSFLEEHHVWVIQPSKDSDYVEDLLDDNLDFVLEALAPLGWLMFEDATRSTFTGTFHAYDITVRVITNIETEE